MTERLLESAGLIALGGSATFVALLIFCGRWANRDNFRCMSAADAMEGTDTGKRGSTRPRWRRGVFLVARVYPLFSLGAIHGGDAIAERSRLDRGDDGADRVAHCAEQPDIQSILAIRLFHNSD